MTLNCLGDMCPVPLMNAIKAMAVLAPGEVLMMVTDHSCVVTSINEFFKKEQYSVCSDEVLLGVWEIAISKKS